MQNSNEDDIHSTPSQKADENIHAGQTLVDPRQARQKLGTSYDFIVCGSGSSGSVVARRLAENADVNVLLLEAGGSDDCSAVREPALWPTNLGSERDWGFVAQPNPHVNGRTLPMNMGKVLGGGSSINAMAWARGHKSDWDYFASEAGDDAWSYSSVLNIYRRIENWHGEPDPTYRGIGGPIFVQPAPDASPMAAAMVVGARTCGIPIYENPNGRMMEGDGGASLTDLRIKDGQRESVFRSYLNDYLDRSNLTVLTDSVVTRLILENKRVTGVEVITGGQTRKVLATSEVVLSLGAINTPKLLMQSGIGDESELRRLNIPVVQHLPGVGQNFQDHFMVASCMWEFNEPVPPRNNASEATLLCKSDPSIESPDIQIAQIEIPFSSPDLSRLNPPSNAWGICPAVVRPQSRGFLRLTGADPHDTIEIHSNILSERADYLTALRAVEISRDIGNSAALRPFVKREVMPSGLRGKDLENFIRDGAISYWHQTCTAKMGRDPMSVVDGKLRVYGIDQLRIADGSILPRITTGNTMAPCVIVGERAAEILCAAHGLSSATAKL